MTLPKTASTLTKNKNAIEIWKGQSKDITLNLTKDVIEVGIKVQRPIDLTGVTVYFSMKLHY